MSNNVTRILILCHEYVLIKIVGIYFIVLGRGGLVSG